MNERIKELAKQCRESYLTNTGERYTEFDEEKFAELIIKECIDLCELWNVTPGSRLAKEIKKQFGVE